MNTDWKIHHEQTRDRVPSPLLAKAVTFVDEKLAALDLGAGALRDSRYLLQAGFRDVYAVDAEILNPEFLDTAERKHFHFIRSSFEQFAFPVGAYDLVNASHALHFNPAKSFPVVWGSLVGSLKSGGVFTGQLLGTRDEWSADNDSMNFHSLAEAHALFANREIIDFTEEEIDRKTQNGTLKHWHIFNVIARKR